MATNMIHAIAQGKYWHLHCRHEDTR